MFCTTMAGENPMRNQKHLMPEVQMQFKKHKSDIEINLKEKPIVHSEEMAEVSEMESNPSNYVSKENSSEVNDDLDVFQSILPKSNPMIRKVIHLSKSILYPERPSYSSTKRKPVGCKTIFVNGLPQKITEGIIKEIFERYGSLEAVRMPEKHFCYISFSDELSVESAVCLSGYRLKIDNKNEAPYSGILYVDYAQYGLDQNCCPQDGNYSIPSTYPSIHNSKYKCEIFVKKLQNKNTFYEGLWELTEWLKRKEYCNKNTIDLFSLMQIIYFHVVDLVVEEEKFEQDVTNLKPESVQHSKETCELLVDVENAFKLSQEKHNWFYFTNNQKKVIKLFEKHCKEWKILFIEKLASDETSFEKLDHQLEGRSELCRENVLKRHLEDSEEQNQEHHIQDDHYFRQVNPFLSYQTNDAASFNCEELNDEETLSQAASAVLTWLGKVDCTGENKSSFFFLIQCIHNHVTKLHSNKNKSVEKLKDSKGALMEYFKQTLCSLAKVEKIYATVYPKLNSNHFTFAEKRSFELQKKFAEDLRSDIEDKKNEYKDKQVKNKKKY